MCVSASTINSKQYRKQQKTIFLETLRDFKCCFASHEINKENQFVARMKCFHRKTEILENDTPCLSTHSVKSKVIFVFII